MIGEILSEKMAFLGPSKYLVFDAKVYLVAYPRLITLPGKGYALAHRLFA
jgi:hypothetical protein